MPRDLAFGAATLVLSAVYYWMAASVPLSQLSDGIGPQGMPKVYSVILAALSLLLMAGALREPAPKKTEDSEQANGDEKTTASPLLRAAAVLLVGVVYLFVVPWVGYPIGIAALILATVYCQGASLNRSAVLIAICGAAFFWVLFVALMGIAQPPGIVIPLPQP